KLWQHGQNPVRQEPYVRPDLREKARENRSIQNPKWMVDRNNCGAGFRYVLQIGSRREIQDLQEVEQPVSNGARYVPGLEVVIDAGKFIDSEDSAQQFLQTLWNRERNDAGKNGFKYRGCHHLQNPRTRVIYSW